MAAETSSPLGWQRYTFSIVGVQKSGTSTLSALFNAHVNIAKAPRKEIHYFDKDHVDWSATDHADYGVPRRRRVHQHMGDATPRYLAWPGALERMQRYDPGMLLMAIFRDPLDRLFSHWTMLRLRHGEAGPDWAEFTAWRPDGMPDRVPADLRGKADPERFQRASGVLRGYYGSQVRRGLSLFGREQWLFMDFTSFLADHRRHLDQGTDFLGLPRFETHPELRHLMKATGEISGTPPTGEELLELARLYQPEVAEYAALTGLPVDHWTTVRLLDGRMDADELAARYAAKAGLTPSGRR
ncbi:sulfotransferase domain-containing protein [Nocardioides campestrisoli]|uniref:sulfotransferase domain-containing protein n=1 Tax=Nocardioides campestrisoli TaxID=2736757 RepID=UPI0015E6E5D7|nr:sulfotransferase domain-containing protein [Nocardioides campestrisoli]